MKNLVKPLSWDEVQGTRGTETRMYVLTHEDFEHRITPQFAQMRGF